MPLLARPFWRRLALHALWLHGFWEAAQCLLFYTMNGTPFTSALWMATATGGDVALTLALVAMALRLARGRGTRATFWALSACGALSPHC